MRRVIVAGMFAVCGLGALAQTSALPTAQLVAEAQSGGRLHGVVKSGVIPLPGVTVTAQNTLTGKRYSTTTDISGAWTLLIPQNGRYVLRTQFAGFAPGAQEALLNATSHDQTVSFDLMLASRAAAQQESEAATQQASATAIRQLMANGAQNLSLTSTLTSETESQAGPSSPAGAALPSIAGNTDFSSDSVAISGQSGAVSPLAGLDMDRVRDAVETLRAQGVIPDGVLNGSFGGLGFGGPGGFGGGGRGNFRGFNPGQPHGAIFWMGSNSALNAEPFNIGGGVQPQQPSSGSNRFGITFMSAPYLPGLTKPSGKDMVFLTLSGTRTSSPLTQFANVPTDGNPAFGTVDERTGDLSVQPTLYNPVTLAPYSNNQIPVSTVSAALLNYFPLPNLPGYSRNYELLATQQSNSTQAGVRYMRSLGANATQPGGSRGGLGGGRRTQQSQGLRQSINFNYNWSGSASDSVNIFPQLGGKSASNANSFQAGYTVGYHKVTSIFNANWNRSTSQATNFFTNGSDIANELGIAGTDGLKLNYGLPNITLSSITGLNEQQPSFSLSQTIALSETLSWMHAKHNLRFGGDYRRVHRDFLGGSNATGTFTFSGLFTEDAAHDATTGSSLADFLLGLPQETAIDASAGKSYLRDNVWDVYATDDWRASNKLTLNYGLRYEFYAPYTEKYNRLGMVDTNPGAGFTGTPIEVAPGGSSSSGKLPESLVFPYRTAFAPRVGAALRLPRQTVVRAGYGVNYTVGAYASFASTLARQPIAGQPSFVNEQTNVAAAAGELSLAHGFSAANTVGNYEIDPHYRLPYVQAWNLDVQKSLPWGVVLNVGYNGSRGNHLDIKSAPRATSASAIFDYEQSAAFSKFNAGTLRVNKRLSSGISLGASYQYSHSIDDAGALGSTSTVVAQDWQNLCAEEGNSSTDQRHRVSGNYLYELPFGKDKFWITSGVSAHILEGFSISGSFTFATGTPLTPSYQAAVNDVANGIAGTQRPNFTGVSVAAGAGSLKEWFNPAAFKQPAVGDANYPYGSVSRNSIAGPGTVQNNMALSKTMQLGGTRSMELRAMANNVFNTVQYAGVDTNAASPTFGQVTSAGEMRACQFTGRFRF